MELEDVVILFDEMEEFIRSRRREEKTEYVQRIWTTCLLPKLQELRDRSRTLFFVATNHYERMDEAIGRLGRFDFLVAILPPSAKTKRDELRRLLEEGRSRIDFDLYHLLQPALTDVIERGRGQGISSHHEELVMNTFSLVSVDENEEERDEEVSFREWFEALTWGELLAFAERGTNEADREVTTTRARAEESSDWRAAAIHGVVRAAKRIVPRRYDAAMVSRHNRFP
jgi:SpoVK/Ycf46/Vps4 family AAA+-type ATPase